MVFLLQKALVCGQIFQESPSLWLQNLKMHRE